MQPVRIVIEFSEAGTFGTDVPVTEDVVAVATGGGDFVVLDGEDHSAGGFAQRTDS